MRILFCLLFLILAGCATKSPKEDLKSVFLSVRDRKYQEAEAKLTTLASKSMIGLFDTYNGETVKSVDDSGNYVFARLQGIIEYCDKLLAEVMQVNISKSDEDHQWDNHKVNEADKEFKEHCSPSDEVIVNSQNISSVDFKIMFKDLNSQFGIEIKRIHGKFSSDQATDEKIAADATAAKERYEQSEEYYSKKLCEMKAIVNAANSIIDKEKEVSKVSGYVDKKKMHDAGQAIVINQKRIQNFGAKYKVKFGKDWHGSSCK